MRAITLAVFLLLQSIPAFSVEPYRIIAIMENERLVSAEPDIQLTQFFTSPNPAIRARAILAAARIGNKSVLSVLQGCVSDSSSTVRKQVAFALGQIRAKEGLRTALIMLKDPDSDVRRLAIEAAGRIGGIEAAPVLLPFLNDSNLALREQTALSLALIKDKGTVDALIGKAGEKDEAQWSYVYALYRLADERSIPVLHQVIAQPVASPSTGDPSSLLFALKALWIMKKPLSLEETDRLLQHPDQRVRQNALDVLAAAGDKSACETIEKHLDRMTILTKGKAIDSLGSLGCADKLESLLRETDPTIHGAALQALAKTQKEGALAAIRTDASDHSWLTRWHAAQALAVLKLDQAIPILKTLINDSDSAVRLAALDSFAGLMPETADLFVPLLQNKDFAVRATAADALGKTKDRKYLPQLLETYRVSSEVTEIEGRVAVLDVLSEYNTSETLDVYRNALLDPEFTIRRHAIDGIKKLVGSQLYSNEKVVDPEDFLYRTSKVSAEIAAKYPADFGEPVPDRIVEMKLEKGIVQIRLCGNEAPIHARNFQNLVKRKFYDGLRIHRVVPNFVIQGGDPRGDGWGGAGEIVHDQINLLVYRRGIVGMPIAGKDTGGSQFFITISRQPHLDGNYTIFGEVISGMDVVDRTEIGDKLLSVRLK